MYCFKYAILRDIMSQQWSLLNMWFVAMFEERLLIEAMFVFLCRVQVPPAPVFTRQPFVHSSWQRPEARSGRSSRQPRRGRGLSRNKYPFSARITTSPATSDPELGAGCWHLAHWLLVRTLRCVLKMCQRHVFVIFTICVCLLVVKSAYNHFHN